MPIAYQVDERGFIETIAEGKNTPEDYMSVFRQIGKDPQCEGITRYLFNSSGVELSMTGRQMEALGSRLSSATASVKLAVLVASDAHYGVTRMFQVYSENDTLQIFWDRDEAIEWLLDT